MNGPGDLAEALTLETLHETAENFFGARRRVEQEQDMLLSRVEALRELAQDTLRLVQGLHALLPDPESVNLLYETLGVTNPSLLTESHPRDRGVPLTTPPFGFTRKSRYRKFVLREYTAAWDVVDAYNNGRYIQDPERTGGKILSVNYNRLHARWKNLEELTENVNRCHSPSGTLCFVRSLDPSSHTHDIAGGTLTDNAQTLDDSLRLSVQSWESLDIPAIPALPEPTEAAPALRRFIDRLYDRKPRACRDAMAAALARG